ncbi:MAG TPA: hypothetical protein VI111_08500 [Thermoleophilaceae bacterium]
MKRKTIVAAVAVLALAAGGAGVATALGSSNDSEGSANGPGADKAKAAALAITGGGTANQVERDNENGATWEVEVTKPDGTTVDVRLDGSYNKVVVERDHADGGKDDAGAKADDHGTNEAAEHGAETNDDGQAGSQQ